MNKTIALFVTATVIAASVLTFASSANANGWGGGYGKTPGVSKWGGSYGGKPSMGGGSSWGGKPGGTFACVRAPCNAPSGGKWGEYPRKVGGKWPHGHYGSGGGGYYPGWHHRPIIYPRPAVIVRPAPVIYPAPVAYSAPVITKTVVAAPVAAVAPVPAPANICTCLTKEYGQDGSVIFKDICTNEAAIVAPQAPAAQ